MFSQFQNEIIAVVLVILVLFILYIFSRKSNKNALEQEQQQNRTTTLKETHKLFPEEQKPTRKKEEVFETLTGKEEGSFDAPSEKQEEQPLKAKSISKRDVPPHGKITKQHFTEFKGERILVAEDNLINQKVLSGLLAGSGIELVMANDGQEALDILEDDRNFLMILMDAHMPRVDGFEATRIIRANTNYDHILVVALSGDTAADDIAKMRDAGMSEQLEKPLRMEALYNILYAYTGENRSLEEDNNKDEEYIEVIETKELHGDKGLHICGGDEAFYHEILSEFVESYKNSDSKLLELMETDELQQADKLLLDIIGVSANIGADLLKDVATEIKNAINEKKEDTFYELISLYRGHLQRLLKDIHNYQNT